MDGQASARAASRVGRRVIGLAAVLVVLAAGCANPFSSGHQVDQGRVLVVGDSVTALSSHDLKSTFSWAQPLDVEATPGDRTDELLPEARKGADRHPQYAVFMPGYNDVLQDRVGTSALDDMVELAAGVPCSVWLTLPTAGGYLPKRVRRWNDRVRSLAEGHDSVHVVDDWQRLVTDSPSFTFVIHRDAVHPNAEGQRALAQAMAHALERECDVTPSEVSG